MKRDLELSRELLLAMEESPSELSTNSLTERFEQPGEILAYHALLLEDAGLIHAAVTPKSRKVHPQAAVLLRLTHEGHEFIESVRSDTTWNNLKQYVTKKGLEVTLDTAVKALPGFIAAALGG